MPTSERSKRKRIEENEKQARQCRRLFQFFSRPESPSLSRADESQEEEMCSSPMPLPDIDLLDSTAEPSTPLESRTESSALPNLHDSRTHATSSPVTDRTRNNSGHKMNFDPNWQINRPWLINEVEYSSDGFSFDAMYCSLCRKWDTKGRNNSKVWNTTGCVSTRLDVVTKHESSEMHKDAVFKEMAMDKGIEAAFETMNKKEIQALKDAQKVLYFLIQHNLPYLTLYEPLMDLCIALGATNLQHLPNTKNATYRSAATATEFLDCQAEVVETRVSESIKTSESYGLMVDEYTDISARKHLAMVCRFVDNGASRLAFLQDVKLSNGEAETIYSAMKGYLASKEIPLRKMTSFASDGPAVMVGKRNGVVAKLQHDNPEVLHLHCMNHRLQLAVSKAFKSIPMISNTDELLTALFKYYHYSTVRSESLQAIQNLMRETGELENQNNITVKRAVHTRWLSHEAAVQTVRKLYAPILTDLENAVASGRDKVIRDGKGTPASSLLKMLKNYDKLYFIHLLCDICTSLASLTRTFEREDVDLSIIESRVTATLSTLRKMKERDPPFTSKVPSVAQSLGIATKDDTHQTIQAAKNQFIDNLTSNIEDRLENSSLIDSLSVLNLSAVDPNNLAFYGDAALSSLANHFNLDEELTLHEWSEMKEFLGAAWRCAPQSTC
ncbi:zinc finger protein 862-like [Saccostrea cucullata]|uniref:zinc finger protein 862-like n=1 Tax=Saccostrea cuccullata TaxID=36930 RepID=UPI002ED11E91